MCINNLYIIREITICNEEEIIYVYSRAKALEDGALIDVSSMAKKAGVKIPVAITCAVWDKYVEWTDEDNQKQTVQDHAGRLWDILKICMNIGKLHWMIFQNLIEVIIKYLLFLPCAELFTR